MARGSRKTDDRLRLAGVLCMRLCHDLSGPLGTLMGTLELARQDHDRATQDEALELAGESAAALGVRLRLLRAAWAADPGPLALTEFRTLAAATAARRVAVDASGIAGPHLDPAFGQVLLNLALLGGESLPAGGTVTLAGAANEMIMATIDGCRAAWPDGLAEMIDAPERAWAALDDARTAQAPLTVLLARAAGLSLKCLMAANSGPAALLLEAPGVA